MPSPKQKPILFLREKITEMMRQTNKMSKPVFGAAVLLLLGAALTLTVVIGLNQGQPYPNEFSSVSPAKPPSEPTSPAAVSAPPATAPLKAEPVTVAEQSITGPPHRLLQGQRAVQHGWQLHPVFKDWRFHNGIDIMAGEGEPVTAVWTGQVKEIFRDKTAGLTVAVVSGEYTVYYGSLATADVQSGAKIKAGARIGTVGSSQAEPYPHLHLAVKIGGKYIDPSEKL